MTEEITFDLKKLKEAKAKTLDFLKKYGVLFLILIPIVLSIGIRMIPENLPITNDWARNTVEGYYKNAIYSESKQKFPNLPDQNLANEVEKQYAQFYSQNKAQIEAQIKQASQEYKSKFQDENGYTYMPDIDPYTFLRDARNYLNHGYIGDEIRNGTMWNTHMVAPIGTPVNVNDPHPIVLAYLYKIMSAFNSRITLMQSATYFPVIFAALAIIPIFFIVRRFAGNLGGFFAATMLAINGAFLGRTSWGHADTDPYNILFALYFVWFVFIALRETDIKKIAIYSALSGLTIGLFSWFWSGWWYVFDFTIGAIGLYAIYLILFEHKMQLKEIKHNEQLKKFAITAILILLSSGLAVSLFKSPDSFVRSVFEPISFMNIKSASHADLWPNVYTTVAELNSASAASIINSIGGNFFFYSALLGLLLLFMYKKDGKRDYLPEAILFALWFIGILYASTKGIRFTMMLVPPIAVGFGAFAGIGNEKLRSYLEKASIPKKITSTIFTIILLLVLLPYTNAAANSLKNDIPIMNDAWYDSLTKIKMESQPNAIITSWWDFGHHFKYVADRAVTFDGASQNTPMAHWVGRALLTNNEKETVGILRMLSCGSSTGFDVLNSKINNTHKSIDMLYDIILMDKSEAENYLLKQIDKETTTKVLSLTHCNPPENYFITSGDMVAKAGVWAHFGSWDFNKADAWINGMKLPKDDAIKYISNTLNLTEDQAKQTYFQLKSFTKEEEANTWIAPWPGYANQIGCIKKEETLICGGVMINLTTMDALGNTGTGLKRLGSIGYIEDGIFIEKKLDSSVGQSVLLLKEGLSYSVIICSPEVVSSTFTKLFYYNGVGMKNFSLFNEERQLTGDKILVWKVKW